MRIPYFVLHFIAIVLFGALLYRFCNEKNFENVLRCIISGYFDGDDLRCFTSHGRQDLEKFDILKNSSVWCWGSNHLNRICYFHNLYFVLDLNEFIFIHGEDSSYHGLPDNQFDPALLELSSVHDHNGYHFNYVDMAFENATELLGSAAEISNPSLVLQRFHPDNLMHVFHDDLIPIHHTLQVFAPLFRWKLEEVRLFFADKRSPGKYKRLYEMFSFEEPVYKSLARRKVLRFSRALVGLLRNTTWYQYGFARPQGPLDYSADVRTMSRFREFVKGRLGIDGPRGMSRGTAVLSVRKQNRLILNELELVYGFVQDLGMKVEVVSEETHSLFEIISRISSAELLVGMHGSLLILSLFLQPGALLVELFPYAINPENYTPYKTLVGIPGMGVSYASWRNVDAGKTVTHSYRSPSEGGIEHLTVEGQERILSSTEVPSHLCCEDPSWLFRIYQDTEVNVEQVVQLVKNVRRNSPDRSSRLRPEWRRPLVPSRIKSPQCLTGKDDTRLTISWTPPTNVDSIRHVGFVYELWLQEVGSDSYQNFHTATTAFKFTSEIKTSTSYNVWIRCVTTSLAAGPFNAERLTCKTN